ncbi:MAG: acyl carrier protein [Actinomycetota bacterium]
MGIDEADRVVRSAVLGIVPDADLDELGADEDLRDALELDSLDFLAFVETLAAGTGVRLDEDDYPRLRTLRGAAELIAQRS